MKRLFALGAVALAGCSDPAPAPEDAAVDATPYELSIAAPHPLGYAPFEPDAGVEMRVGFQSFRYTRVVLVARGAVPPSTPGRIRLDIEGFDRTEQRVNAITFREGVSGEWVSPALMVYANDIQLAGAVGHRATISVELDDRRHRASATYTGVVRWDPSCIEDSEYRCLPVSSPTDGGTR